MGYIALVLLLLLESVLALLFAAVVGLVSLL